MTITLRFQAVDPLRCRFAVSPLWETLAAVRVLREDGGRHAPWLAGLDLPALRERFALLLRLQPRSGYVPDFLTPPPERAHTTVTAELARVRATPGQVVERELRTCLSQPGVAAAGSAGLPGDPLAARDQLAGLLADAWQLLVEPHWPRLSRLLSDDVTHQAGRLAREGLAPVLAGLARGSVLRGLDLVVPGGPDETRDLGGDGLVLVPSAFSWPAPCIVTDPSYRPMLVYPCRGVAQLRAEAGVPPQALAGLLGRGRAGVLAALTVPAGPTELATALGLRPSTVSEHLTALRDAGLLASRRSGHAVRYARTPLGDALVAGG